MRFQILNRLALCDVHLLLDFCPRMGRQILKTCLLISHILHCLLKLSLLSRVSNRTILQVNIISNLLKVSKFRELCELRGQSNTDIRYCLRINILKAAIIPLEPIRRSSILRLHSLTRLIL